jgi:hypothetical protein
VQELSPLVRVGSLVGAVLEVVGIDAVALGGAVDELEDERSSSDNAGASRQAV